MGRILPVPETRNGKWVMGQGDNIPDQGNRASIDRI